MFLFFICVALAGAFAGAFAATGNIKELVLVAAILVFSYVLVVLDISSTPLMLGMILADIMEMNFVTSMMSYDKDYLIFFKRPISCVILIITVILVISMLRINKKVEAMNQAQLAEMMKEHEEVGKPADEPREHGTDWAGLEKPDSPEKTREAEQVSDRINTPKS